MKDLEYLETLEFWQENDCLVPANENAIEFMSIKKQKNELIVLKNITSRDLKFHNCYFSLLKFVWSLMPVDFKVSVPFKNFYKKLKSLNGEYEDYGVVEDGKVLIEYKSISFSKMKQHEFKEYVASQIPLIYAIVMEMFDEEQANMAIEAIEQEYNKFLSKLS